MSDELTTAEREWMLKEAERHMRDYAARGVSNNAATVLLEEYDRRGEAMKTLELGMLAGLLALGLDKETADRVGDRMRAIVGLGPDREPLPR